MGTVVSNTEIGQKADEYRDAAISILGKTIAERLEGDSLNSESDDGRFLVGGGRLLASVILGVVSSTKGPAKTPVSFGEIKKVLDSAQTSYKGTTVVGHALSKHAGRNPDIWGKTTGAMSTWNEQAMKHLREIARAPGEFKRVTNDKGLTFIEKMLPDGRGVRLNLDGTFKGFID